MNFKELSEKIASTNGLTKTTAEQIVKQIFETIQDEISNGGEVAIHGFGRFTVRQAAARFGRNLTTGAMVEVPARKVPKFVPHSALKDAVKDLKD